jgi:hypothetical protein
MSMVGERPVRSIRQRDRVEGLNELFNAINGIIARTFGPGNLDVPLVNYTDRRETPTQNNGKVTVADLELPAFDKLPYCRVNFFEDGTCDLTPAKSPASRDRIEWDRCTNWRGGIDHAVLHHLKRMYQVFPDGRSVIAADHIDQQVRRFQ